MLQVQGVRALFNIKVVSHEQKEANLGELTGEGIICERNVTNRARNRNVHDARGHGRTLFLRNRYM